MSDVSILNTISKDLAEVVGLTHNGKTIDFPEKKVVEFRLARANSVIDTVNPDDNSTTKKVVSPAGHGLAPRDMIKDPYDEKIKNKVIMNIVGYTPMAARPGEPPVNVPEEAYLHFGASGSFFCTHLNMNQYYFLKLHNKNRTNPNRIATKPVVFFEVDETKEATIKNNLFDYKALATVVVFEADDDPTQLLTIAQKISQRFPKQYSFEIDDAGKLKAKIASIAETQPIDFLMAVKEPKSYARLVVDHCVAINYIYFDNHVENLSWSYKDFGAKAKGRQLKASFITKLDSPTNPIKGLVKFLLTAEGNKHLLDLSQKFEEHYPQPR